MILSIFGDGIPVLRNQRRSVYRQICNKFLQPIGYDSLVFDVTSRLGRHLLVSTWTRRIALKAMDHRCYHHKIPFGSGQDKRIHNNSNRGWFMLTSLFGLVGVSGTFPYFRRALWMRLAGKETHINTQLSMPFAHPPCGMTETRAWIPLVSSFTSIIGCLLRVYRMATILEARTATLLPNDR